MAAALPAGIADLASWATEEETALAHKLLSLDQAHLFAGWKVGEAVEKKKAFFTQVSRRAKCWGALVSASGLV